MTVNVVDIHGLIPGLNIEYREDPAPPLPKRGLLRRIVNRVRSAFGQSNRITPSSDLDQSPPLPSRSVTVEWSEAGDLESQYSSAGHERVPEPTAEETFYDTDRLCPRWEPIAAQDPDYESLLWNGYEIVSICDSSGYDFPYTNHIYVPTAAPYQLLVGDYKRALI